MALQDRLRPWHALMLAVFAVGAGSSLLRTGIVTVGNGFIAVLSGLFAVVIFQFTVGNVWGYAVEYYNAGGDWTDTPFLAPFIVGGIAGIALGIRFESVALGAWVAFWMFTITAALVAVGVWFFVGYREQSQGLSRQD